MHFLLEEAPIGNGYDTSFFLHVTSKLTGKMIEFIGPVSIVKKGQQKKEKRLLRKYLPNRVFARLPDQFVSISFSVDLFMALSEYLSPKMLMNESFMKAFHLITGKESKYYSQIEKDDCFKAALGDVSRMDSEVFSIAQHYLERRELDKSEKSLDVMKESLTIHLKGFEPFVFGFKPSPIQDKDFKVFPNRIIAFIGKNGTGKSTAIYRIARILYASPEDRLKLRVPVGHIEPDNAAFTRLLIVSYSAFDNFTFPVTEENGIQQLLSPEGSKRFRYIGIRNIKEEAKETTQYSDFLKDRTNNCKLKSISFLANEIKEYYDVIQKDNKRLELLNKITQDLTDPILSEDLSDIIDDSQTAFLKVSSGHKFFIQALLGILASIEPGSLILFDEPENHIHPPLVSKTIKYIRWILDDFNSFMFVSTHSPVVIQELFANNVYKVKRFGEKCFISHPNAETFGENLEVINTEVFDLSTDLSSAYDVFDKLYEEWNCGLLKDADSVIRVFQENLRKVLLDEKDANKDRPILSNQMIMYLIGKKLSEKQLSD